MKKPFRAGKVAHDLGLSTWFGGTLFGQVSLNAASATRGTRSDTAGGELDQMREGVIVAEAHKH
jgi:hypothetical protein